MSSQRSHFIAAATQAAEQVASILGAHPLRAQRPYEIGSVLSSLIERHDALQRAVAQLPMPIAVDADGRPDQFGAELAELMSYLQLLRVLYHGLDDIPDHMRVAANRYLSATHLTARRVRDRGHRLVRRNGRRRLCS